MSDGFSSKRTAEIVGISYRQLDYWARTDLIRPSSVDAAGSGSRRRYAYRDLLELKIVKKLLDAGLKLELVRDVFDELHRHVGDEITSARLVIDGSAVALALDDGELIDLLQKGQGVLNVMDLGQCKADLDAAIVELRAEPDAAPAAPARNHPAASRRAQSRVALRTSPLDAAHRALGAKLTEFGGWDMPLSYPTGTLAEHAACREGAAVFDVSHLGTVRVRGPEALGALQVAFTNDLGRIGPGRAQYTHLLDEADASVLDDIIVWWVDDERFDVMPNASNTERVRSALGVGPDADVTGERAILAVQGPDARTRLATVFPEAAAVERFHVARLDWQGTEVVVAGTGYTGEDGVELAVPAGAAPAMWEPLLAAGCTPAGLGARDTLRLEAGLPLHGHELGPGITSLQAGLGWVVRWDKGPFRGREPLEAERAAGPRRRLRGIATEGRRPPRAEQAVVGPDGTRLGEVTSGNFSPVLGHGIALAFLPPDTDDGAEVGVEVRPGGDVLPGRVVKTPFVSRQ